MQLSDLIAEFRTKTGDTVQPYLWEDSTATGFYNNAVAEAAIRADLIFDHSTTDVCEISLAAGTKSYTLHSSISRIAKAYMVVDGEVRSLTDIDRLELDRTVSNWRAADDGEPLYMIVSDTSIQVHPAPSSDYETTLYLEVYREPLDSEKMVDTDDSPVIAGAHHRHLTQWALHEAYGIRDDETEDPARSAQALAAFTDHFGERPDADRMRKSMTNRPHYNKVW